jgi:hypothetical protein
LVNPAMAVPVILKNAFPVITSCGVVGAAAGVELTAIPTANSAAARASIE